MNLFKIKQKIKINKLKKRGVVIGKKTIILNQIPYYSSEPYLITIGDECLISANVFFCPHDGGTWVINRLNKTAFDKIGKICIGNNVYIGFGAIIFGGVTVGNNCIIGANSIVTHDVPDNTVVCGSPAKVLCSIEEYVKKNSNKFVETFYMKGKEKRDFLLKHVE